MTTPASFNIVVKHQLIRVDLQGVWTLAADSDYLIELMAAVREADNAPWALLVDMRGWQVDESLKAFKLDHEFHLDRRNQKAECWLIDHPAQGEHLAHYLTSANVPLHRCFTPEEAGRWLNDYGFSL